MNYSNDKESLRFFIVLLINIIFFLILSWLLPIRFETGDDITMARIVNGTFLGTPSSDMTYQSILYGKFLCSLYKLFPSLEWYTIFECIFQCLASTIIIYFILLKINQKSTLIVSILTTYSFWALFICRLQFTSTTAMLAFASCLLLLNKDFIIGGFFLIISSLLRFESAGMICLFMMPAFLWEYKFKIKQCYIPISIILLLISIIHFTDYRIDCGQYNDSNNLNGLRSEIQDSPHAWRAVYNLPDNVSVDEYKLFYLNHIYDSSVFDELTLQRISSIINSTPLKYKIKDSFYSFIKPNIIILFIVIILYFFCIVRRKHTYSKKLLLSSLCLWLVVLTLISLKYYVKIYVLLSSLLPITYYLFSNSKQDNDINNMSKDNLIVISLLCIPTFITIEVYKTVLAHKSSEASIQNEIISTLKGKVWPISYDECKDICPFQLRNPISDNIFPYSLLTTYHNNRGSFQDLVDQKILIFTDINSQIGKVICNSLLIHNGIKVNERIILLDGNYKVFQIEKTDQY